MHYAKVIHDAWKLTNRSAKLKWFCFVPSFAAVVFFVGEIAWQFAMTSEEFGLLEHHFIFAKIGKLIKILSQHDLLGWAIFLIVIIILFQFVLFPWIQSTLILAIKQMFEEPEKRLSLRERIIAGGHYFFKLFELHAILSPFSLFSIALFSATMFRFYHGELFSSLIFPAIIIFAVFALIVNIFIAFTPYFVVCAREDIGDAIKKSISLVFVNFGATMTIIMLMILVNFRIIINVLVVIGVPLGISGAVLFFAKSSWLGIAITLSIIAGVALLALATYLTAIVEVFSTAVWERAFTSLINKELDLDPSILAEKSSLEEEFKEIPSTTTPFIEDQNIPIDEVTTYQMQTNTEMPTEPKSDENPSPN